MSNKPERIVIENKAGGPRWEKEFFLDIEEAIMGGYRIARNPTNKDCSMRNYFGYMGRAVFYLEGTEPEKLLAKITSRKAIAAIEPTAEVEKKADNPEEIVTPVPEVVPEEDTPEKSSEPVVEVVSPKPTPTIVQEELPPEAIKEATETPVKDEPGTIYDEDILAMLTKKDPLLQYAKKIGVVIPDDMTIPAQIKRFIKDSQAK